MLQAYDSTVSKIDEIKAKIYALPPKRNW
jgi:hypothetical protein